MRAAEGKKAEGVMATVTALLSLTSIFMAS